MKSTHEINLKSLQDLVEEAIYKSDNTKLRERIEQLKNNGSLVNEINKQEHNFTPMHYATLRINKRDDTDLTKSEIETLRLLIHNGADINANSLFGTAYSKNLKLQPVLTALVNEYKTGVEVPLTFFNEGRGPAENTRRIEADPTLNKAVEKCDLQAVEQRLSYLKSQGLLEMINGQDSLLMTPLHNLVYAIRIRGRDSDKAIEFTSNEKEILKLLILNGANVNILDKSHEKFYEKLAVTTKITLNFIEEFRNEISNLLFLRNEAASVASNIESDNEEESKDDLPLPELNQLQEEEPSIETIGAAPQDALQTNEVRMIEITKDQYDEIDIPTDELPIETTEAKYNKIDMPTDELPTETIEDTPQDTLQTSEVSMMEEQESELAIETKYQNFLEAAIPSDNEEESKDDLPLPELNQLQEEEPSIETIGTAPQDAVQTIEVSMIETTEAKYNKIDMPTDELPTETIEDTPQDTLQTSEVSMMEEQESELAIETKYQNFLEAAISSDNENLLQYIEILKQNNLLSEAINQQDEYGNTPLILLAYSTSLEWLDKKYTDQNKHTKMIKKISAQQETIKILLQHGANTNLLDTKGFNALMCALRVQRYDIAELLLETTDVNTKSETGYTALIIAAMHKNPDFVEKLLIKGAEPGGLDYSLLMATKSAWGTDNLSQVRLSSNKIILPHTYLSNATNSLSY